MKKIIFAFVLLGCCISSALAMNNPLDALAHPNIVQSSSCTAANPSAPTFCGDFINASVCVCLAAGKGAVCTVGYIKSKMEPANQPLLNANCDSQAKYLPSGETPADCKAQIQDYFNQCPH